MAYKTNWLSGLLCPMLVAFGTAHAVPSQIATNNTTTLFIDNGAVHAMGENLYGSIQPGSATEFRTPYFTGKLNAISVAAVANRTAVLFKDGTASFAGYDYTQYAPTAASIPASNITDIALSMRTVYYIVGGQVFAWSGDAGSTPSAVAGASNVKQIAAGIFHLVVLFNDGTVGTLGTSNAFGQLGNGTLITNPALVKIDGLTGTSIEAGPYQSYVLQADGTVKGFGKNTQYQFSSGNADSVLSPFTIPGMANIKKVGNTGSATIGLRHDGTVVGCGWHNYIAGWVYNQSSSASCDELPVGNKNVDINSGSGRTILNQGVVGQRVGWSGNLSGSLGDGTNIERHQIVQAYFTPIAPPIVIAAPAPAPVVEVVAVVEPVVEPVTDTAIALPFNAVTTPVIEPTPVPTITEIVVTAVIDAVVAVVNAVVAVYDAVVSVITPEPAPAPVVLVAPVVLAPVVTKAKCNNGFGNGDQCLAGKSFKNQAENAVVAKVDPTAKPKK